MTHSNLSLSTNSPIVIGGVGGSGTRLIAQCVNKLGYFLGHDLNAANDNLWFALLFTRPEILNSSEEEFDELVDIFLSGMTGNVQFTNKQIELINDLSSKDRIQHPVDWLKQRADSLLSNKEKMPPNSLWGWKAPNSHIVLDRLITRFNSMKYIHVVRNGLDMAFSQNQNQLNIWGQHFIGDECSISPYFSLKYWCITHRRVLEIGKPMGTNFLFLNYDNFCSNPERGILELCSFLGFDSANILHDSLLELIHAPDSIGRFKDQDTTIFSEEDIAYVKALGFDTGEQGH
ncbi:MAG: sulfotransferase [Gammaproteobacteria bacterium]|nr:sulfotransferase [Gammaproteobacteria bacterium]